MKIQEVIDRVLTDSTGETRIAPTCDQLMTGDPQQEVKGIAVTFMATVEVIREAAAKGVNFIITHEPTWFTGRDVPDWCAEDSTYLAKRRLIDETGMTIWRYHDHMHAAAGDRIYWGGSGQAGLEPIPGARPESPLAVRNPPNHAGRPGRRLKAQAGYDHPANHR